MDQNELHIANDRLTDEEKHEILVQLLEDPSFSISKTQKKLLQFLVDSTIQDANIKEYIIAAEVFKKDDDYDPIEDATVRVYVSNLRKKLKQYYAVAGQNKTYQIHIPTGHYRVDFIEVDIPGKSENKKPSIRVHLIAYACLIILLLLSLMNRLNSQNKVSKHPIWNNFTHTDKPVLLVAGNDLFFIEDADESGSKPDEYIVRKHNINTEVEFEQYKEHGTHIRQVKDITTYPFIPYHSMLALPKVTRLFESESDYTLTYSSELGANDILNNSIIFIGSFRNLYALSPTIPSSEIEYDIHFFNSFIQFNRPDTTFEFRIHGSPDNQHTDYCLVRKIPGPGNNPILMFITFSKAAMSAATTHFLSSDGIEKVEKTFKDQIGKMPEYFNIVFKVTGYERTAYKTSIAYIQEIDSDSLSIW